MHDLTPIRKKKEKKMGKVTFFEQGHTRSDHFLNLDGNFTQIVAFAAFGSDI